MRPLSEQEITTLKSNGCVAEDWSSIQVGDSFDAQYVHRVSLYGNISIGNNCGTIEVSPGFRKHCGLYNATLCNVCVGDDCLIENIGGYINHYAIEDHCLISGVYGMETTDHPNFGEGEVVPVLNEAGAGNVMLYVGLNAQMASLQIKCDRNAGKSNPLHSLIQKDIAARRPNIGVVKSQSRVINTGKIVDCLVDESVVIDGAQLLENCTFCCGVHIGTGVIVRDSVVCRESTVSGQARVEGCFVGESSSLTDGFSAVHSLFFANCFMANGEACSAFCGPFSVSHHKGSLLIGTEFSFYNAGSATNFSNHAYKMGPLHWGVLERGPKTASGCHIQLPAKIGAFSVCLGKIPSCVDTSDFPFSYVIGDGSSTTLVPGRNLVTVGLYRDTKKWAKRDARSEDAKHSMVNFEWLSPYTLSKVLKAKEILEKVQSSCEGDLYQIQGCKVKKSSLEKGIGYYDLAIKLFLGAEIDFIKPRHSETETSYSMGDWDDLSGLLLPLEEEEVIIDNILQGNYKSITCIEEQLKQLQANYSEFKRSWCYSVACKYYNVKGELTTEWIEKVKAEYRQARKLWITEICKDAEKEYSMGDVSEEVYRRFVQDTQTELN